MKKIELGDVLDIAKYELVREDYRKRILQIKAKRRLFVGPRIMYAFENYDTMLYQVQEMMRAERIVKEAAILREINVYNELIPDENQLSATMFIATGNPKKDIAFLQQIVGLPDHTYMAIDGERIRPGFDPSQISEQRLSSVQYVKFNLSEGQAARLKNGADVVLGFDHKNYRAELRLSPEQKEVLKSDLG